MEPTGIVSANQDTASGPRSYLYMLHVARLIGFVENWDRIQMRSRNDNNNNDNDSNDYYFQDARLRPPTASRFVELRVAELRVAELRVAELRVPSWEV